MNTDQFDGHTPGPWDADYDPYVAMLDRGESMDVLTIRVPTSEDDEVAWKNQHLAAAAPDLLAEVKRLQMYERFVRCIACYQQIPDGFRVDEELMLRVRGHLRKHGEWGKELLRPVPYNSPIKDR